MPDRPLDRTRPLDPSSALMQQLRDMKRHDEQAAVESTNARARWVSAIEVLLEEAKGWLSQAVDEGLARIDTTSVHVADDDIGAYDAPALQVSFPGGRVVWVRPLGTLRVGGQGLVDLVCDSNRALLVLNRAGVWKIRGSGPTAALVELDAQSFSKALADLLMQAF
jgi:hypothetical protein